MRHLNNIFATLFTLTVALFLGACNDHLDDDGDNANNVSGAMTVEALSPSKTALWVELSDGDYDFALARDRTASDPDLIGHGVALPGGLSAMVVTGENQLIIEADDLVEVWEVPAEQVGTFEMLIRNDYYDEGYLPDGWQPNLFPRTEGEAADLEILLSAFICGMELDLFSYGFDNTFLFSFRFVGETSYYEWTNPGHAKYVFIVRR